MIVRTPSQRAALLDRSRTVTVVGASDKPLRPSYVVFSYLRTQGRFAVYPINPGVGEIDGIPAFSSLAAFAREHGAPDIVDIFRKPSEVVGIVEQAIAVHAKAVWFQYGVINEQAIQRADDAGMDVVVDRCLKVESARLNGGLAAAGLNSGLITSRRTSR
ncbi:MAG: CoA-binding protein [Candidatus Meridianibacter frigidus]|nr:MAG: CoA-binding protein [Candidatus Eremiobacteraeota bacterium]